MYGVPSKKHFKYDKHEVVRHKVGQIKGTDLLTTSTILEYSSPGLFKAFLLVDTL